MEENIDIDDDVEELNDSDEELDEDSITPLIPIWRLTTIDNPYHPIDEYEDWYRFDTQSGYNTDALLQRVAGTSFHNTDGINQYLENKAIDEILRQDLCLIYRKVLCS